MIIKDNNGKRITDRQQLGRYSQIQGFSEIKDVDNCHNGKMFQICTRFKTNPFDALKLYKMAHPV